MQCDENTANNELSQCWNNLLQTQLYLNFFDLKFPLFLFLYILFKPSKCKPYRFFQISTTYWAITIQLDIYYIVIQLSVKGKPLFWNHLLNICLAISPQVEDVIFLTRPAMNIAVNTIVIASQLPGHRNVISKCLWRHQQNENWASETRGVKIFVFIAIYGFVVSYKK